MVASIKTFRPRRVAIILIFLFLGTMLLVQFDSAHISYAISNEDIANNFSEDDNKNNILANCRYGLISAENTAWVIPETGAGIFYKYNHPKWHGPLPENDAEFIHLIRTKQEKTESGQYLPDWYTNFPLDQYLANLIKDNPGDLWMVGNEIERGPNPGDINPKNLATDDIYADIYVEAYHEVYNFIKSNDPTARVANAGLIQITPMRLQYLDMMWDAYLQKYGEPMPVDVWTIHAYVLPELDSNGQPNNIASVALGTDPGLGKRASGGDGALCPDDDVYCLAEHDDLSIFADQIVAMRQWMKDRGQQNKPLVITEYGTLYPYTGSGENCSLKDEFGNCFTPQRVSQFMLGTFDYLNNAKSASLGYPLDDNKLVQQWIWFSAKSSNGNSGNLLRNDATQFNDLGNTFKNHILAESTYKNLVIESVSAFQTQQGQGGGTAQLSVAFRNIGSTAVDAPFNVTFYRDAARTQPIATTTVDPLVRGCGTKSYAASVEWSGLSSGDHQFWVHIDSNNDIPEQPSGNSGNLGSGQVNIKNTSFYSIDLEIESHGNGDGGTVNISPNLPSYEAGTQVTLNAIPYAGWLFEGWEGDIAGNNPNIKIIMNSDTDVRARFVQENYELDINKTGQGTVTITPQKTIYFFGDRVTLKATPANGWRFVAWTGDINDNASTIQITFDESINTTAIFAKGSKLFMPVSMKAD